MPLTPAPPSSDSVGPASPTPTSAARHAGWTALYLVILAAWVIPPFLALLGHLGYISEATPLKKSHFTENAGVLRLKKGVLPDFSAIELRHLHLTEGHRRLQKKITLFELEDPSTKGAYLLREPFIYIKPFQSDTGDRSSVPGYNIHLPWRPGASYWLAWASGVVVTLVLLHVTRHWSAFRTTVRGMMLGLAGWNKRQEHRAWYAIGYATLICLCLAVAYADKALTPYLSAEDGVIFFQENLGHGIPALWMPYAGYLHVIPRIGALLAGFLSVELQPAAMVWFSMAILWGVFFAIARLTESWLERAALAGFFVMAPLGGYLMLSPTNLQWFTGIALMLLAAHPNPAPKSGFKMGAAIIAALLVALSGPFAVIALPGMMLRAWRDRSRFNIALAGSQAVAVAAQVFFLVKYVPEPQVVPTTRSPLLPWIADFSVGLFGKAIPMSPSVMATAGMTIAGLLVVGFGIALLRWKGSRENWLRLFLLLAFAGLFAAAGWVRSDGASLSWGMGERYYVVPYAMIIVALAALSASGSRWLGASAAVWLLCMLIGIRQTSTAEIRPPNWVQKVREITPGTSGFIVTHPANLKWSVYIARAPDGSLLAGQAYLDAEAAARAEAERVLKESEQE